MTTGEEAPFYQNTNTQLIKAFRAHAAKKGIVPVDTEDLKRLCDVAEAGIKLDPALDVLSVDRVS